MARHIALLAGEGRLVDNVRTAATRRGDRVSVFPLSPFFSKNPAGPEKIDTGFFLDDLAAKLRGCDATHLLAAGGVTLTADVRREVTKWLENAPAGELSDDTAPQILHELAKRAGLTILGADELMPEALASPGAMAGRFDRHQIDDFGKALTVARTVGSLDLGQSVVCSGARPIAAEGVEGTDGLIERVGRYATLGLVGGQGALLVLAKALRPGQPRYFDMPTVGPDTVRACAKAAINVIALEAGGCLLVDRKDMLALAERHGVGVVGIPFDD